ncbi:MAG: hypothetical protein ABEH38_00635 [Flavobacteriales bacterium]
MLLLNPKRPFYLLIALAFLASCQPIYRPTVVNQPLMSGKGDVQLSAHTGTNGNDFQAAGAPTKNVVVMGHYNTFSGEYEGDSLNEYKRDHSLLEIGGGFFHQLGDQGENGNAGVVEVIGGYGNGNAKNYSDFWTDQRAEVKGSYHKFFVQPGVGYHHNIFDVGLAPRVSIIDYYEMKVLSEDGALQPNWDRGTDVFLEPALTGRLGYKFVKLQMQMGLSIPVGSKPSYQYQPFMFSIGLHIDITGDTFGI